MTNNEGSAPKYLQYNLCVLLNIFDLFYFIGMLYSLLYTKQL